MNQAVFKTFWGWMGVAATAKGVSAIVLPKASRHIVERELKRGVSCNGHVHDARKILWDAQRQVRSYLSGRRHTLDVPIDLSGGTSFQRRVWHTALRIPYGRVRSYKWIAARVGGQHYSRAVGHALGANPVPLIVPCHRVVAQDASLGGFSGGLKVKRRLLKLERTLPLLKMNRKRIKRTKRNDAHS